MKILEIFCICTLVAFLNAIGLSRRNGGKSPDLQFKNHYCKSKGDYVFTLWTQLNQTKVDFTFNFENKRSNERLKYNIDYHSKFAVIHQDTPNTKCVTIIADELFKKLKQDIATPYIAINGNFSLTVHTQNGTKSSPSVPIKDILKQRISEKRQKSEVSDKNTNGYTVSNPQRSEPPLRASFIRNGVIDNPSHYAFELMINDNERPLHANSIDLIFETDNWKILPISFNIFPKELKHLEYTIQETQISYIIIFEVSSLLQYLIDNVSPRDMLLSTGSIRLLISPGGDNDSNYTPVGFTSEAVQVHDLAKGIGLSDEHINELHSRPNTEHNLYTNWQVMVKITYLVIIAVGSLIIAMHALNLAR